MDLLKNTFFALGGLIVLAIILALVTHIPDWRFRRLEKRDAYSQLLTIKSKGYSWAIMPINQYDNDVWDQYRKNNIYVQAKIVKADCIGHLPNGDAVYKTQNGDRFYYYDHDVTSVLIDSAQNVYIPVPSESKLIDNRLVVLGNDLIIPDSYHVISNPQECKDFLNYHFYLSTYFGDKIPYLNYTELEP